jgi:SAM-dependent methyltransferase
LFSGSFKDEGHTTVDIKPELKPSVVANCEHLPFPDENFDFVLADPPYSEAEAMSLYGLPYYNIVKVLNEMARVCKPGGTVLFFHRLIPAIHPGLSPEFKQLKMIGVVGIFTIAGFSNMRALTVWKKQGKLDGVLELEAGPGD